MEKVHLSIFLWDTTGNPERKDDTILPARVANHSVGFSSSFPLMNGASHIIRNIESSRTENTEQSCKLRSRIFGTWF